MARVGPNRITQQVFSAGMFRSVAPELIPKAGLYDITNGLLDEDATIYCRGGSEHIALLEGAADLAVTGGTLIPDGLVTQNGNWQASGAPPVTAVTDGNGATYMFAQGGSGVLEFSLQNLPTFGTGEGMASITVTCESGNEVPVEMAVVDGAGTKFAATTGNSVTYTPSVPIGQAAANDLRVRFTLLGGWDQVYARLFGVSATWTKGATANPPLPAVNLGAEITFLWTGWIGGQYRTIFATAADFWAVDDQNIAANLGGSGMPAPGRPAVMDGTIYFPGGATYGGGSSLGSAAKTAPFYAVVANRLLAASGNRIDFSGIGTPGTFAATDFHKVPDGVEILGVEGLRDSAIVFTTQGIWVIGNMAFNLTDSAGNVQHRLDHYSTDLVLWGDAGIAGWAGAMVVPARDGIWMLSLGIASEAITAFERISGPIDDLYRGYVAAGNRPGNAVIFRGTYLLPILSGTSVVDVLACRLDAPVDAKGQRVYPWSHLRGYGAEVAAFAAAQSGQPRLLGAGHRRLMELHFFNPGVGTALDADGTSPLDTFEVTTRDYATGPLNENTVLKMVATYQLKALPGSASPALQAFVGVGRDPGQVITDQLVGEAPVDADGLVPFPWPVRRKARHVRFRVKASGAAERLSLRMVDIHVRGSGRL